MIRDVRLDPRTRRTRRFLAFHLQTESRLGPYMIFVVKLIPIDP